MTIQEAGRRLDLFGIPAKGDGEEEVRNILARILAGGSLSLSDMQSARDVAEHLHAQTPGVYLFLAAMQLSLKAGNTFLRIDRGPDLLKAAVRMENDDDGGHDKPVDVCACWDRYAVAAGETLAKGDGQIVVCKDVAKSEKGWFFTRVWDSVKAVSDRLGEMASEEDLKGLEEKEFESAIRFKFPLKP